MPPQQVHVAPHDTTRAEEEINANNKDHNGTTIRVLPTTTRVPGFWPAFNLLATAKWLTVRNQEENGIGAQIQSEITNLGLILALFTTMFLPLYYDEVSRVEVSGDGFAIDVMAGILQPLVITNTFIHEWFDVTYCGALIFGALGTVGAVFLSLAVNEAGSDPGVSVLVRKIGILIHMPYYMFSLSVISFALGVWTHFFLVPHTIIGVVVKLTIAISATVYLLSFMSFLVQGVYDSKFHEERYPPHVIDKTELERRAQYFFSTGKEKDVATTGAGHQAGEAEDHDHDHDLPTFLRGLCPVTQSNYTVPLDAMTRAQAVVIYYNVLADKLQVPLDVLLQLRDQL